MYPALWCNGDFCRGSIAQTLPRVCRSDPAEKAVATPADGNPCRTSLARVVGWRSAHDPDSHCQRFQPFWPVAGLVTLLSDRSSLSRILKVSSAKDVAWKTESHRSRRPLNFPNQNYLSLSLGRWRRPGVQSPQAPVFFVAGRISLIFGERGGFAQALAGGFGRFGRQRHDGPPRTVEQNHALFGRRRAGTRAGVETVVGISHSFSSVSNLRPRRRPGRDRDSPGRIHPLGQGSRGPGSRRFHRARCRAHVRASRAGRGSHGCW